MEGFLKRSLISNAAKLRECDERAVLVPRQSTSVCFVCLLLHTSAGKLEPSLSFWSPFRHFVEPGKGLMKVRSGRAFCWRGRNGAMEQFLPQFLFPQVVQGVPPSLWGPADPSCPSCQRWRQLWLEKNFLVACCLLLAACCLLLVVTMEQLRAAPGHWSLVTSHSAPLFHASGMSLALLV